MSVSATEFEIEEEILLVVGDPEPGKIDAGGRGIARGIGVRRIEIIPIAEAAVEEDPRRLRLRAGDIKKHHHRKQQTENTHEITCKTETVEPRVHNR